MGKASIGVIGLFAGVGIGWIGATIKHAEDDFGMRLRVCQMVMSATSLGFLDDAQTDAVLKNAGIAHVGNGARVGSGTAPRDCSTFLAGVESVTIEVPVS